MRGIVISVHNLGATVRLDDGRLAAIPLGDVAAQRGRLTASLRRREPLEFDVASAPGRHAVARLPESERPSLRADQAPAPAERSGPFGLDEGPGLAAPAGFEAAIGAYLRSLEEREGAGEPSPADRHALRKKRRAAWFEARRGST